MLAAVIISVATATEPCRPDDFAELSGFDEFLGMRLKLTYKDFDLGQVPTTEQCAKRCVAVPNGLCGSFTHRASAINGACYGSIKTVVPGSPSERMDTLAQMGKVRSGWVMYSRLLPVDTDCGPATPPVPGSETLPLTSELGIPTTVSSNTTEMVSIASTTGSVQPASAVTVPSQSDDPKSETVIIPGVTSAATESDTKFHQSVDWRLTTAPETSATVSTTLAVSSASAASSATEGSILTPGTPKSTEIQAIPKCPERAEMHFHQLHGHRVASTIRIKGNYEAGLTPAMCAERCIQATWCLAFAHRVSASGYSGRCEIAEVDLGRNVAPYAAKNSAWVLFVRQIFFCDPSDDSESTTSSTSQPPVPVTLSMKSSDSASSTSPAITAQQTATVAVLSSSAGATTESSTDTPGSTTRGVSVADLLSNSTWTELEHMPLQGGEVAASVIDRGFYVLLGTTASRGSPAFFSMNLDNVESGWNELQPPPYPADHQAVVALRGNLHVLGGIYWNCPLSSSPHQVYSPSTRSWTQAAPMPYGTCVGSVAAVVIDDVIHACGGIDWRDSGNQRGCGRYDPRSEAWHGMRKLNVGVDHAAAGTDGNRMYVFGGRSTGKNRPSPGLAILQVYDPPTNVWATADMPFGRGGMGSAPFSNGRFYVMGGETNVWDPWVTDGDALVYDTVLGYDPVHGVWLNSTPMPVGMHGVYPVADPVDGVILLAGGGTVAGKSESDLTYAFKPPHPPVVMPGTGPSMAAQSTTIGSTPAVVTTAVSVRTSTPSPQGGSFPPQIQPADIKVSTQEDSVAPVIGGRKRGADLPAGLSLNEAQGLAWGGNLWVFGGFDRLWCCMARTTYAYSAAQDTWISRKRIPKNANLPVDRLKGLTHSAVTTDGDWIFLVGGMQLDRGNSFPNAKSVASVWAYSPVSNSWVSLPDLPGVRAGGAASVIAGRLHFVAGGLFVPEKKFIEDFSDHWTLDLATIDFHGEMETAGVLTSTEGWVARAPLPEKKNHLGGVKHRGRFYVFGGQLLELEHTTNFDTAHVYNSDRDDWSALPRMPVGLGHIGPSIVSLGDKIIIVGGTSNDGVPDNDVMFFDPESEVYTLHYLGKSDKPGASPVVGVIDGSLYIQVRKSMLVLDIGQSAPRVGEDDAEVVDYITVIAGGMIAFATTIVLLLFFRNNKRLPACLSLAHETTRTGSSVANNADIIAEVPATGLRLLDGPVLTAYGFDTNDTLAWKPNPIHVPSTIGSESDCATVVEADSDFAAESCQSRVDGEGRRIISVTSASLTASDVGGSSRRLSPTSNGTATASNRDGYRSDPAQHRQGHRKTLV